MNRVHRPVVRLQYAADRRGAVRALVALSASLALAVWLPGPRAQPAGSGRWPTKPLRLIVGFPIGSAPDVQARLIAEPLATALGQPVNIDNRPGDSGNTGAALLARESDDHTIGIVGNGQLTGAPWRSSPLPFDPQRDFAPIALLASAPLVWVAKAGASSRTAAQFIAQARARGPEWRYGSTGPGSGMQLAMEQIKLGLQLQTRHVSFANAPMILGALLDGSIEMALLPASVVMPLAASGEVQVLAVSTARPTPLAPSLPALEDIGLRGVDAEVWNALVAPAGMPRAYRQRLSAELDRILGFPELRAALLQQGWRAGAAGPQAVAERVHKELSAYRK